MEFSQLVEIPEKNEKENIAEYEVSYKKSEVSIDLNSMNDEELNKYHQSLIMKLNKLKDEKKKSENSQTKQLYIKTLHNYNELKANFSIIFNFRIPARLY